MASGRLAIAEAIGEGSGPVNTVSFLVEKLRVSLNTQDSDGSAAIHHAARRNIPSLMEILIKRGADPNIEDGTGQTAWEIVSTLDYQDLAEYLDRREGWALQMNELRLQKTGLAWSLHNNICGLFLPRLKYFAVGLIEDEEQLGQLDLAEFYNTKLARDIVSAITKHISLALI